MSFLLPFLLRDHCLTRVPPASGRNSTELKDPPLNGNSNLFVELFAVSTSTTASLIDRRAPGSTSHLSHDISSRSFSPLTPFAAKALPLRVRSLCFSAEPIELRR